MIIKEHVTQCYLIVFNTFWTTRPDKIIRLPSDCTIYGHDPNYFADLDIAC